VPRNVANIKDCKLSQCEADSIQNWCLDNGVKLILVEVQLSSLLAKSTMGSTAGIRSLVEAGIILPQTGPRTQFAFYIMDRSALYRGKRSRILNWQLSFLLVSRLRMYGFISTAPHIFMTLCLSAAIISLLHFNIVLPSTCKGARCSVVGWGIMLRAGRSRFRFPMMSLGFSIILILRAALWLWCGLRL
jgi:hypothetical protein